VLGDLVFKGDSDAYAIECRLDDQVWVIDQHRAAQAYRDCLSPFLNFPSVRASWSADANARVIA
jgi:hypothetical protein